MSLETWMQQLGQEFRLEEWITTQEPGRYSISFSDNIDVSLASTSQGCLMKGTIGPFHQTNSEAFLVKVMEANLFGQGTRGAALGLNEEGTFLTLSMEVDYNSSYKEFKEKVEDFISVIDFWRKEAAQHHSRRV